MALIWRGLKNCDFETIARGGPLLGSVIECANLLVGAVFLANALSGAAAALSCSRSAMCCSREVRSAPTWRHVRCGQPSLVFSCALWMGYLRTLRYAVLMNIQLIFNLNHSTSPREDDANDFC
jgi:hypothetical protein